MTRMTFLLAFFALTACGTPEGPGGKSPLDTGVDCEETPEACDQDGDGVTPEGGDCDDTNALVNPEAEEICNELDDDCDGSVDEGVTSTFYMDADSDGYGGSSAQDACTAPTGYVENNEDCDDTVSSVNPGATEACDEDDVDEDCDGFSDDDAPSATGKATVYTDADGDGYGAGTALQYCDPPTGYVENNEDCDDSNPSVNPGATEVCDSLDVDEDCDGFSDDDDSSASGKATYYTDTDGDGYGDEGDRGTEYCDPPTGVVVDATDCDDTDLLVNPGATEVCDGSDVDEDCDGLSDDDDSSASPSTKTTYYRDADGDGYGGSTSAAYCDRPSGYVATSTDCDDSDSSVNPGATEVCDSLDVDEDCDGLSDDDDSSVSGKTTYYTDADGDGYGDSSSASSVCDPSSSMVSDSTDCDDSDSSVNPGATETCNGTDDDCDGTEDEGLTLYYPDADSDSYGDSSDSGTCSYSSGLVADNSDCDDSSDMAYPGATEYCDGIQNDCSSSWTSSSEDGVVSYVTSGGSWSNISVSTTLNLNSSGTYYFCAGTYTTQLVGSSDSVDVIGVYGSSDTTLEASSGSGVYISDGSVYMEGFTITGGSGSTYYTYTYGGGVYVTASSSPSSETLSLVDCSIESNSAQVGGGVGVVGYAWVSMDSTIIWDNEATRTGGGGIYAGYTTTLDITDSLISENDASYGSGSGGGIYGATTSLTITGSDIDTNWASNYGGGLYVRNLEMDSSFVYDNLGDSYGGGIYVFGTTSISITDSEIYQNTTSAAGGGLYLDGSDATFENSEIYLNSAQSGAGFWTDSDVEMTDTSVYQNTASYSGGGGHISGGATLTLDCSTTGGIYQNTAPYEGGGVWLGGPVSSGAISSTTCDWGTGSTNNSLYDVSGTGSYTNYSSFGSSSTFTCDSSGCS